MSPVALFAVLQPGVDRLEEHWHEKDRQHVAMIMMSVAGRLGGRSEVTPRVQRTGQRPAFVDFRKARGMNEFFPEPGKPAWIEGSHDPVDGLSNTRNPLGV